MAVYYFDTSALGKRYIPEIGTLWVKSILRPAAKHDIIISSLVRIEVCATLARRHREGHITHHQLLTARKTFFGHMQRHYQIVGMDQNITYLASSLTLKHPLRSLDAIHLATAIIAAREFSTKPIFVSADTRLLAIAQAEGFPTDDPNLHP